MKKYTTFVLGEIEMFRRNLENVAKVLERFKGVKGLTRVLTRSLTKV
jgi:hypothetical protein